MSADASASERVEELEEAIRNVLDVVMGWTRSMTDGEKFRAIQKIGYDALGIVEDGEQSG